MAETDDICLQKWETAETFPDLITLNRRYLQGDIPTTPYHCGPIEEETHQLVSGLLRLHDFGILTYQSQPYERSTGRNDGKYYEHWQKPFICFVMENASNPLNLLKNLKKRPGITVYGAKLHPYKVVSGADGEELIVTQYRLAESAEALKSSRWEPYTCIYPVDSSADDFFGLEVIRRCKPWLIDVAVTAWGVDLDLLKLIEQAAKEVGLVNTNE